MRKLLSAALFSFILLAAGLASAQKNEFGIIVGGVISPATDSSGNVCTIFNPSCGLRVHTENVVGIEGIYTHRILDLKISSIHLEFPVVGVPDRTTRQGVFSQDYSSIFFTPSLKLRFSVPILAPWVSLGGGLAHFSGNDVGAVRGQSVTHGALQAGAGLDLAMPIPHVALRFEAREFYAGRPDLLVTSPSRHNIFTGGGVLLRF